MAYALLSMRQCWPVLLAARGQRRQGLKNIGKEGDSMSFDDLVNFEAQNKGEERPEVQELIALRDRFIADHPQMREAQEEIDRLLSTTLDPRVRLEILFMLISEKLIEMREVFEEVVQLSELVLQE